MANITTYLQTILENQKQLQEATRSNSVNIARMDGELTKSIGSIKALLHVLNHRIENNVFSSSVSRPSESHQRSPPGHTRTGGDGDISGTEGVHKECLQEHFAYIVKELMIEGTTFIDELQEDSCLTEGEASDIHYQRDQKTKARKLICAIYTRDRAAFSKFMKRLQRDNYHIYEKIQRDYSNKLQEGPRSSECLICVIKRDVDVRRVVDKLCSHFIIDIEYLSTFLSFSDNSLPKVRKEFWEDVFLHIDKSANRTEKLSQLRDALYESKYKLLAEKLGCWNHPKLTCNCNPISAFKANFSDSFSTTSSIGDFSTTSNIRSKSHVSLQSVSSLEEDVNTVGPTPTGGNMPYTVAWVNSSPAINPDNEPWSYPNSKKNLSCSSQTVFASVNSTNVQTESKENDNPIPPSFQSNGFNKENYLNVGHQESSRLFPTRLDLVKSDAMHPPDVSTDEVDSLLKPSRLKVNIEAANKINKKQEMMPTPLPVVDAYTGRKKVYKKKRHTRTRSDESSKISLEYDLFHGVEQDRLRLINGLVDTPERGLSEIFHSNVKRIPSKDLDNIVVIAGDTTDTSIKSETCDETCCIPKTDSKSPVPTPNRVSMETSTDKSSVYPQTSTDQSSVYPQTICNSDRNNNPQYNTDLVMLTPSRQLDPLSSGLGTRNDSTTCTKKRNKKEKNRSRNRIGRLRFDTY